MQTFYDLLFTRSNSEWLHPCLTWSTDPVFDQVSVRLLDVAFYKFLKIIAPKTEQIPEKISFKE